MPELNWLSVAVNSRFPLTYAASDVPTTSILSVYQAPGATVKDFAARVVEDPETSFFNSILLLLRRVK